MGLAIVMDKSAFQSLSFYEMIRVHNYYKPNIAPILVQEILGDLSKEFQEGQKPSNQKVKELANKLFPFNSVVNCHYVQLMEGELMGFPIDMDFRPIVGNTKSVKTASGAKGQWVEDSGEEQALRRWRDGNFQESEKMLAKIWRQVTKEPEMLNKLKELLKKIQGDTPKFKSLQEVEAAVNEYLNNTDNHTEILQAVVASFDIDPVKAQEIFLKWEQLEIQDLDQYAPYSLFCYRVKVFFQLGLRDGLLTERPTDMIDLQYLFYLPFCLVFCSDDKFHKKLVPFLISDKQTFIKGSELKQDIKSILSKLESANETEQEHFKSEPPHDADSLTSNLWEKYFDWPPKYERKTTAEEQEEALRKMKEFMAAKDAGEDFKNSDDLEFIVKESWYRPTDLCPCGSGKMLKDCHLPNDYFSKKDQG